MSEIEKVLFDQQRTAGIDFDPEALRAKYREERDKRLRADGNEQYVEVKGDFSRYVDDPYVDPGFTRAPLTDAVDVVIIGGGFGGCWRARGCARRACKISASSRKAGTSAAPGTGTAILVRSAISRHTFICRCSRRPATSRRRSTPSRRRSWPTRGVSARSSIYIATPAFRLRSKSITWSEEECRWIVTTNRDDRMSARFVVMSNGPLNRPKLPGISRHRQLQGAHLPHQPLGLRLHGRRYQRKFAQARRQARRRDWHRRDGGPVRTASRQVREASVRVSAHAFFDR